MNNTPFSFTSGGSSMPAAAAVTNVPAGTISATNVQAALNELDAEKAGLLANAFTGRQTITGAFSGDTDTNAPLVLTSTDPGAIGTAAVFYHNSASPAVSDVPFRLRVYANNSAATKLITGNLTNTFIDPTAGSEDSTWAMATVSGGTLGQRFVVGGGLYHAAATGGDKGDNSINFGTIYENNVRVATTGLNVFTGSQSIAANAGGTALLTLQDNSSGALGPQFGFYHNSASPAANDFVGSFQWNANNSTPALTAMAQFLVLMTDPTAGSEDCDLRLVTRVAGTLDNRLIIGNGIYGPNATGGPQGDSTANFTAVYDDGVILCAPFHPEMSQADWDAITVSAAEEEFEYTKTVLTRDEKGWQRALRWATLGAYKAPVTEREVTHKSKRLVNENGRVPHITAKRHFRMLEQGFEPGSPDSYLAWMSEHKCVPAMPSLDEWRARMLDNGVQDKMSSSERFERVMLALDYLSLAFASEVSARKNLEARVDLLERTQ